MLADSKMLGFFKFGSEVEKLLKWKIPLFTLFFWSYNGVGRLI